MVPILIIKLLVLVTPKFTHIHYGSIPNPEHYPDT
jgi:hypothetical protein